MKLVIVASISAGCAFLSSCGSVVEAYADIPKSANLNRQVQFLAVKTREVKLIGSLALVFLTLPTESAKNLPTGPKPGSTTLKKFVDRAAQTLTLNGLAATYVGELEQNPLLVSKLQVMANQHASLLVFEPIEYSQGTKTGGGVQYKVVLYDSKLQALLEFEDYATTNPINTVPADNAAASWLNAFAEAGIIPKLEGKYRQPPYQSYLGSAFRTPNPVIDKPS